jgi:phosphoribosylamine--glycine ligase
MPSSQDHKRAFDNDEGPNTGGMGAFSPAAAFNDSAKQETIEKIVEPTIRGLKQEGRTFKGVLYFGLMVTKGGVKVVEYNSRFGDPEAQTVLPLLKTDFVDVIFACINGTLDKLTLTWENKAALCVVIASGGYPTNVTKGYSVTVGDLKDVTLISCGTAKKDGRLVTNGGRVFCLTTTAATLAEAREIVYREIDKIKFQNCRYRTDIGKQSW